MPYDLQYCDPPLELVKFSGGYNSRFVTVDTAWSEASSTRPLRSAWFMRCSAYLFLNNKTSLAQLFHIYPAQSLESRVLGKSLTLREGRIEPFLAHMRATRAEVTMIPILGTRSVDRHDIFTTPYRSDIQHVAETVRFNSQDEFKPTHPWKLETTVPWDLLYRPKEGILYLKSDKKGCFRLQVHDAGLPPDVAYEDKLRLLDGRPEVGRHHIIAMRRRKNDTHFTL